MLFLALDTTTSVCGAALGDENALVAESFLNVHKTHSERLMPLIVSMLEDSGFAKERLEGVAVTIGPGSFTGIRIGVATARGLAQGLGIPLVGVMTLDALVEACPFFPGLICPMLDARKDQLYAALYRGGNEGPALLEGASALSLGELRAKLERYEERVLFLGDAVAKGRNELKGALKERYEEMPLSSRLNRAALVLQKGLQVFREEGPTPLYSLGPYYIRLPEAERRRLKEKTGEGD